MANPVIVVAGSVTQGSANAFATSLLATGIASGGALRLREVLMELFDPAAINQVQIDSALARYTPAAFPNVGARTLIASRRIQCAFVTSGAILFDRVHRTYYSQEEAPIIVEEALAMCVDSNGCGGAGTVNFRCMFETAKITDAERIALLSLGL